jgi:hypothetical protein
VHANGEHSHGVRLWWLTALERGRRRRPEQVGRRLLRAAWCPTACTGQVQIDDRLVKVLRWVVFDLVSGTNRAELVSVGRTTLRPSVKPLWPVITMLRPDR